MRWSAMQGSNLRPSGPKPDALPGCANRRSKRCAHYTSGLEQVKFFLMNCKKKSCFVYFLIKTLKKQSLCCKKLLFPSVFVRKNGFVTIYYFCHTAWLYTDVIPFLFFSLWCFRLWAGDQKTCRLTQIHFFKINSIYMMKQIG